MLNAFTPFLRIISLFAIFSIQLLQAQNLSSIKGKVISLTSNEPIAFANVIIDGTTIGSSTDINGVYEIKNVKAGFYNVKVSYLGYKPKTVFDVQVVSARPTILNILMEDDVATMEGVVVEASPFTRRDESPVSLQTLGVSEIQRNPGGNRDISRAIQALPGVASGVAFRNDIIIRGGAPNENRFYLDGVEVPNINHFATQGASGGPVGIINVDLIREVDFYSGAFPANRGNTLSSILEFKQKDARTDKSSFRGIVGASDIGLQAEGPIGKKTTYLVSARRSYLQFLFNALGLPFLPTYNGFQGKIKHKIDQNNEISFIGLGAIDQFALNTGLNLSLDPNLNPGLDSATIENQQFILDYLPVNSQWNYTNGIVYKRYRKDGSQTFVLSRNMLSNRSFKYEDNDESKRKLQDYTSTEAENKFRYEYDKLSTKGYKINFGVNYEYARYTNSTFQLLPVGDSVITLDFDSKLRLHKWGVFGQTSKSFFSNRLAASLGFRADANNYSTEMRNLLQQFSPRLSLSYNLNAAFSLNFNTGIYYQLPPYTVLGFRDNTGNLVNQNNGLKYIKSTHFVTGLGYYGKKSFKASFEGFYKIYDQYPFLLNEQISLANFGSDFGIVGNAPVNSTSTGRAYGLELLLQQKMNKGFYGIASFTFVRSEFSNVGQNLTPSAWDNRYLMTLTAGKILKKDWEIGLRYRFVGPAPTTPLDITNSSLIAVWDVSGRGLPDYNQINTQRFNATMQLDFRIDKKWNFEKFALNLYFDVQNATNYQTTVQSNLLQVKDANGNPVVNPDDPSRYLLKSLPNQVGQILPTIGVIVDF